MPTRRAKTAKNPHLIKGEIEQFRRPEWVPLLEAVGDLSPWFMWMGEIGLEDGTSVHAYKHRDTRRYLHLGMDGRWFAYVEMVTDEPSDLGRYRPITALEGLDDAFHQWGEFHLGDEAFGDVQGQLELARDHARSGEKMPYDVEFLARQRRFEAACDAARRHEHENDAGFSKVRFDDGNRFFGDLEVLDEGRQAA